MKNQIKVGDKVRYLNARGGGRVARITGNVAWIEDEDGFELPTHLSECVVVEEADTFVPAIKLPQAKTKDETQSPKEAPCKEAQTMPPMPHLLMPERPDGDSISIAMAWLMTDPTKPGNTSIECYLINDCNYTIYYQLLACGLNGEYSIISEGELERDTKLFIEEIESKALASREKICLQYMPFKRDKAFKPKIARTIDVPLDVLRLLKKHAYTPNDFFDEDALVVTLVENDNPCVKENTLPVEIEPLLKKAPQKDIPAERRHRERNATRVHRREREKPIEVDLHANLLVSHPEAFSAGDLLAIQMNEFRKVMNEIKQQKGTKVIFIHGKGEGILRKAILDELKRHYPKASAQDASFKEYGFGATQVTIH